MYVEARKQSNIFPSGKSKTDDGKLEFTVDPEPHVSAAKCILATRDMIDSTDCSFMADKGALHDICSRGRTEGRGKPKDEEEGTERGGGNGMMKRRKPGDEEGTE
jgi:hypothetical protein